MANILLDTGEDKGVCVGKFPMHIHHVLFTAVLIEIGFKAAVAKRSTVEAKPHRKALYVLSDMGG
jgi:hypothetical protein